MNHIENNFEIAKSVLVGSRNDLKNSITEKFGMKKRILVLDSFRGLAAMAVALFHFTTFIGTKLHISNHFSWGHHGVQLFFMISGFVIFMSAKNENSPVKFLHKRFLRLYPTYWLCLLITSLFLVIFPQDIYQITVKDFYWNFTMFQGLLGIANIDGSYWSLIPELLFYVAISLLILFKLKNKILWIILCWMILIFLNKIFPSFLEIYINLRFGVFFIAGIMFYRIYFKLNSKIEHLLIFSSIFLLYFIRENIEYTLVYCMFIVVFYLFIYNKLGFLENRILFFFGKISYPLYLLHQTIGISLLSYFLNYGLNSYLTLAIVILIIITIASVVVFGFEIPLTKKIKSNRKKFY